MLHKLKALSKLIDSPSNSELVDLFEDADMLPLYRDFLLYCSHDPFLYNVSMILLFRGVVNPELFQPLITFLAREYTAPLFQEVTLTYYEAHAILIAQTFACRDFHVQTDDQFVIAIHTLQSCPDVIKGVNYFIHAMLKENIDVPSGFLLRYERAFDMSAPARRAL